MRTNTILTIAATAAAILIAGGIAHASSNDGLNRHVVLHNTTDTTIYHIYATNSGSSNWLNDTLASNEVMVSDEEMNYNMDDGTGYCLYDIKAVFRNGEVRTGYKLNMCTAHHIDITADGVVVAY